MSKQNTLLPVILLYTLYTIYMCYTTERYRCHWLWMYAICLTVTVTNARYALSWVWQLRIRDILLTVTITYVQYVWVWLRKFRFWKRYALDVDSDTHVHLVHVLWQCSMRVQLYYVVGLNWYAWACVDCFRHSNTHI